MLKLKTDDSVIGLGARERAISSDIIFSSSGIAAILEEKEVLQLPRQYPCAKWAGKAFTLIQMLCPLWQTITLLFPHAAVTTLKVSVIMPIQPKCVKVRVAYL